MRDFKQHNYGFRTRQIWKALHFAGKEAVRQKAISELSVANAKTTYRDFGRHLKDAGVYDLRDVMKAHVRSYADDLRDRVELGSLEWRSATEYLSRVNAALERASGVRTARVTATQAGFPRRDGIARVNRAQEIDQRHAKLPEQHQAILGLCRHLKLRFEEAVKFNAKAVVNVSVGAKVLVDRGTKGGRPRFVEIRSQREIDAIQRAAMCQAGKYTQMPAESSYRSFKSRFYRALEGTSIAPHSLRHRGAQELYKLVAGVDCPLVAGVHHNEHRKWIAKELGVSIKEAREIDIAARLVVATELGHSRLDITNSYLG